MHSAAVDQSAMNVDVTSSADRPVRHGLSDLDCAERPATDGLRRAFADPTMLCDERVLGNLLAAEDRCLPNAKYFEYQSEVKPFMRQILTSWMLEVCEDQRCEEEVFVLAVNYLDRFLSAVATGKSSLQMLGAACLLIASKLFESVPFSADKLVTYTDHSVTIPQLLDCELMVLQTLKWDVSVTTPFDFVEQIFVRLLPLDVATVTRLRRHCHTFVALSATDFSFASYPASMVAAGCMLAAAEGILGRVWVDTCQLVSKLHCITSVDTDCIHSCREQIERLLAVSTSKDSGMVESSCGSSAGGAAAAPTTPTDALEVVLNN